MSGLYTTELQACNAVKNIFINILITKQKKKVSPNPQLELISTQRHMNLGSYTIVFQLRFIGNDHQNLFIIFTQVLKTLH